MEQKYKAMYKSELARAAGVSLQTFRYWLKRDNININLNEKILSPSDVKFLCEKYVIVLE